MKTGRPIGELSRDEARESLLELKARAVEFAARMGDQFPSRVDAAYCAMFAAALLVKNAEADPKRSAESFAEMLEVLK